MSDTENWNEILFGVDEIITVLGNLYAMYEEKAKEFECQNEKEWINGALGRTRGASKRLHRIRDSVREFVFNLNPELSYYLIKKIIDDEYTPAEKTLMQSPKWAVKYAWDFKQSRFFIAEPIIATDLYWKSVYNAMWQIDVDVALNTTKEDLSYEELMYFFDLDEPTGLIYWKNPTNTKHKKGDRAGTWFRDMGMVKINGKNHYLDRVVYIMANGTEIPKDHFVFHKNNNSRDNRPSNLGCGNNNHMKWEQHSKAVYKQGNKWITSIGYYGANYYLGSYQSRQDALIAYNTAKAYVHDTTRVKRLTKEEIDAYRKETFGVVIRSKKRSKK